MDQKDHKVIPHEPIKKLRNKSCLAINGNKRKDKPTTKVYTTTTVKKDTKESYYYNNKVGYNVHLKLPYSPPYKTTHKKVSSEYIKRSSN